MIRGSLLPRLPRVYPCALVLYGSGKTIDLSDQLTLTAVAILRSLRIACLKSADNVVRRIALNTALG